MKAQFKIQQMVFMLIAVMIFFVMVFLYFIIFQSAGLREQVNIAEKERALLMSEFLAGSVEFNCKGGKVYCIDTDKLMSLKNMEEYEEFWPVSDIKVRKLTDSNEKVCTDSNYPDCNVINVYRNNDIQAEGEIGSFVALCRYNQDSVQVCELGKLSIGYEVK